MQLLWQEILTHIVGFVLLLVLLRRFLWAPLLGALDARRAGIAQGLADVERATADIERLKDEYSQRLTTIEDEARVKLREATLEGKRIATEIQEQAHTEARKIIEEMKGKLHLEIAQAKVELRNSIAALAVDATERLLKERLDADKDRALVTKFLGELESTR